MSVKSNREDFSHKHLLVRVFHDCIEPRKGKVLITILLMIISSVATATIAYLIKPAVDETMFKNSDENMLILIPMVIVAVTLIKAISQYGHMLIMQNMQVSILNSLRERMFSHFITSDIKLYSKKSSGGMISNMTNDLNSVMNLISLIITGAFLNFFTAIALFGNMLYQNAAMTFVAFFIFPLAFYPVYWISKRIKFLVVKNQRLNEKYFSMMDDSLSSVKVVKSYNAEDFEISKMRKMIRGIYRLNKRINKISVFPSPFMESLAGVGMALVLWYSGSQVLEGHMTPGQFFSFFATLMMAYKPIKALAGFNTRYQTFIAGTRRAYKIMDDKAKIKDTKNAKEIRKVKGDIKFDKVSFSYDKGKKILNDVSFNLEAGGRYALVGRSGGGKSTILNMLLRFYDPDSGKIILDGKDIKDIKLQSLRSKMAYVGQETHLFEGSITDNIRYGNLKAKEKDIIEAAKKAQAHEFIVKLPRGYDTRLGQRGGKLSGGQRQRISIARAILSDAPILLLDEATSALDLESEKKVQKALEKLMEGRTTLIIAHRLSTVIHSDKIFVVDKGDIVESGTHKELLSDKNNLYHYLYNQQF